MQPVNRVSIEQWGEAYDNVALQYDVLFVDRASLLEDEMVFEDIVQMGIESRESILDLGCGTGLLLDRVPQIHPIQYQGVDLSSGMIAQAKSKHHEYTFVEDDMRWHGHSISNRGSQVDAVISTFGSMTYIPLSASFKLLDELVMPGGIFYVMFYSPDYQPLGTLYKELLDKAPGYSIKDIQEGLITPLENNGNWKIEAKGLMRDSKDMPYWSTPNEGQFIVVSGERYASNSL